MKILLTGSRGQVGFELQRTLAPLGKVIAPTRAALDLADAQAVEQWLEREQPQLIVNAAAWTAVDLAESEEAAARRLNAELPAQLASWAARHDALLVHFSSDYVYPGDGSIAWQESSQPKPLSVYGQTKLAGDLAILESGAKHLIFRTSWVYSARGNNFMKTMLRLGGERDELRVVADQIGAPTSARLIANVATLAAYRRLQADDIADGVYHLCPRGETSWQGFAQAIFTQAAALGHRLAITPERVLPIPTAEYPTPAQRPLNSRLSLQLIEATLGVELPDWQDELNTTLEEFLQSTQ